MFRADMGVFLNVPNQSAHRVLHPATVLDVNNGALTVRVEGQGPAFELGEDILLFYQGTREFMQQVARLEAVMPGESGMVIGCRPSGDAVSAESRQCFRVSMAALNQTAIIGNESGCQVVDVSATGFSAMSSKQHPLGKTLDVMIDFRGKVYQGKAAVHGVREMLPGKFRYGLHGMDTKSGGTLVEGLKQMSATIQREQLRRLSGTN
ncbi:MAG TPA: hypothetical protein VG797_05690 [Phycisphaerales bacterium]|nr:hypothetical protein [Phycisphaerales bacterium]